VLRVKARTGVNAVLDLTEMFMQDSGDIPEYKACHIYGTGPMKVEFFSTGACAGGSYLALQTPVLGRKYVIASYYDNPGIGGISGFARSPSSLENSKGCFLIIAPHDSTRVTITPNA